MSHQGKARRPQPGEQLILFGGRPPVAPRPDRAGLPDTQAHRRPRQTPRPPSSVEGVECDDATAAREDARRRAAAAARIHVDAASTRPAPHCPPPGPGRFRGSDVGRTQPDADQLLIRKGHAIDVADDRGEVHADEALSDPWILGGHTWVIRTRDRGTFALVRCRKATTTEGGAAH